MSGPAPASVVVPTKAGEPQPSAAAAAIPMKGGMLLSPLPLTGGRRGRKTRRLSKKVLKMLKKIPASKLKKMMKGSGEGDVPDGTGSETGITGGRRRRGSRKTRRSGLLY